jgi:hypothetical protein
MIYNLCSFQKSNTINYLCVVQYGEAMVLLSLKLVIYMEIFKSATAFIVILFTSSLCGQ